MGYDVAVLNKGGEWDISSLVFTGGKTVIIKATKVQYLWKSTPLFLPMPIAPTDTDNAYTSGTFSISGDTVTILSGDDMLTQYAVDGYALVKDDIPYPIREVIDITHIKLIPVDNAYPTGGSYSIKRIPMTKTIDLKTVAEAVTIDGYIDLSDTQTIYQIRDDLQRIAGDHPQETKNASLVIHPYSGEADTRYLYLIAAIAELNITEDVRRSEPAYENKARRAGIRITMRRGILIKA